jgi:hypothetical protein
LQISLILILFAHATTDGGPEAIYVLREMGMETVPVEIDQFSSDVSSTSIGVTITTRVRFKDETLTQIQPRPHRAAPASV